MPVIGSSVLYVSGCGDCRTGILVENTTAYFVIRNVFVHDGPTSSANIVMKNASNGRVEASKVVNGNSGIVLWVSERNSVTGNEVSGFGVGIDLVLSRGNVVEENSIQDAGWPITVRASSSNKLLGNVIEGRALASAAAGVSIEMNSSFNVFEGNIIHGGNFGVSVEVDSHSNLIKGNLIESMERSGIQVGTGSQNNTIDGNVVIDSGRGILLNQAFDTKLTSNWISSFTRTYPPGLDRFTGKGIWVIDSSNTLVQHNSVTAPVGISICNSSHTFRRANNLRDADRKLETFCP